MSESPLVYLIDDDDDVRASVEALLGSAGISVRAFPSGAEFLKIAPQLVSGCVLTDLRMPGIDGIELQERLIKMGIDLPLVMMTGQADVPTAIKALKSGAADFIEKPFKKKALVDSVNAALEKGFRARQARAEIAAITTRLNALTQRETEVLSGLVAGRPNKVIAHQLGMSPRTVEVHRARIMVKTGADSLSELVRMAMKVRPEGGNSGGSTMDGGA